MSSSEALFSAEFSKTYAAPGADINFISEGQTLRGDVGARKVRELVPAADGAIVVTYGVDSSGTEISDTIAAIKGFPIQGQIHKVKAAGTTVGFTAYW